MPLNGLHHFSTGESNQTPRTKETSILLTVSIQAGQTHVKTLSDKITESVKF